MRFDSSGPAQLVKWGLRFPVHVTPADRFEGPVEGDCLIDTGATHCAIAAEAAKRLQLAPVAVTDILTFNSTVNDAPIYMVTLSFPEHELTPLQRIPAVASDSLGAGIAAIIGRSGLQRGRMVWNGLTGLCDLTFGPPPAIVANGN